MWKKVEYAVDTFLQAAANILIVFAFLVIIMFILTRWLINLFPSWGDEISMFAIVWSILIMIGKILVEDKHVKMDVLLLKCPPKVIELQKIFINVFALIMGCIWLWAGMELVIVSKLRVMFSASLEWLPLWVFYLVLPIFASTLIFYPLIAIVKKITKHKKDEKS